MPDFVSAAQWTKTVIEVLTLPVHTQMSVNCAATMVCDFSTDQEPPGGEEDVVIAIFNGGSCRLDFADPDSESGGRDLVFNLDIDY